MFVWCFLGKLWVKGQAQIQNKAKAVATKKLEEESKTRGAEIKSFGYMDPCANVLSYKLQDWLKNE